MTEVSVSVEAGGWAGLGDPEALVRRAVEAALAVAPGAGEGAEVAVLLTDDEAVRALNRSFRRKDTATNVLSFPAAPPPPGWAGPRPLGDVALAWETVAREAEAEGKAPADHLAHLVVHGTLHLLGRDHESDEAAEAMEALEVRALANLGVADPYRATLPGQEHRTPTP